MTRDEFVQEVARACREHERSMNRIRSTEGQRRKKPAMTPAELKEKVEAAGHSPHFFTRKTMQFFGDTMSNYRVRSQPVTFKTVSGETVTCWVLERKRPVNGGLQSNTYFDTSTFERQRPPHGEEP